MIPLTEEQRMLVKSVEEIADREFAGDAFTWEGEKPWENARLLAEEGYLGIGMPEKYGGGGMSEVEVLLVTETVGRICPDTARFISGANLVAPRAVEMFGTEAAKEKYLPPVIQGRDRIAIAISEPKAGSDVKNMNTHVREEGGNLYLTGEKLWPSEVPSSSSAVVWCKFPEGMGAVVMDFDWSGVEIGNHFTNMAGYTQSQFFMEDVHIPKENVLVRGPEVFKEQLNALNWERIDNAVSANTWALSAFDKALEYAQDREQFGQKIGNFQGIEWKLADMAKQIQVSRAFTYNAVQRARRSGNPPGRLETSIAKLYAAEMAEHVTSEAVQIHGANGYQRGHPVEYLYRLARGRRIAGGTDEIQKNTIAEALTDQGLPDLTDV
jgi:alkylation response protein AidB-like acyl-CoA dehydrogenase